MESSFGEFLSQKRKQVGLTQKQLGEMLFVSESTVSKWEKNKSNPDISMIQELASILKVSEHELLVASEDKEERRKNKDAKKWRILSSVWDKFFIISYITALFVCLICNLAVNKTLSWFWTVFFSIVLSATFTTIPKYITNYRLVIITITQLLALMILLLVCSVQSEKGWFYLASLPILTFFVMIFLPIYIVNYNFPKIIKNNNSIISLIIDYLIVLLMLYVICVKTGGDWFNGFATYLLSIVYVIALTVVLIIKFVKTSKLIKGAIITALFIPFSIISYYITKILCQSKLNVAVDKITVPNLSDWSSDIMISSNVYLLILLSLLTASLIQVLINSIIKKFNKKKKIKL